MAPNPATALTHITILHGCEQGPDQGVRLEQGSFLSKHNSSIPQIGVGWEDPSLSQRVPALCSMVVQHGLEILGQGANDGLNVKTDPLQRFLLHREVLAPGSDLQRDRGRLNQLQSSSCSACPEQTPVVSMRHQTHCHRWLWSPKAQLSSRPQLVAPVCINQVYKGPSKVLQPECFRQIPHPGDWQKVAVPTLHVHCSELLLCPLTARAGTEGSEPAKPQG